MDPAPVTREEEFLKAILDEQRETNRLLQALQPAQESEILQEPARPQQQKGGKHH
jgi:hypothetical protein